MPREGMLIQLDGSYHRWLGDDGPQFTILFAVDDATGTVVDALFCEQEDAHNYFLLLHGLVQHLGNPSPSTPTGTGSSDTRPAPASLGWQPSSAGLWRNWVFR